MARPRYAIIVAGGQGIRMQHHVPKQFIPVAGKPVLMHTLAAFYQCSSAIRIITVLPEAAIKTWENLIEQYAFSVPHQTVAGGDTRSASVAQGLRQIGDPDSLVAVHDGVRPLVSPQLIETSYREAAQWGSAVASVPFKDSIRQMTGKTRNAACAREQYRLIQTPQTFRTELLREAYEKLGEKTFSDDASVVEYHGHTVYLIEGEYRNIKVTTPEDLVVAEALLSQALSYNKS